MIIKYLKFINEKNSFQDQYDNIESKVRNSKKLSKDMKELILPLIKSNSTRYNNGIVYDLTIPNIDGKSFNGVSLGADKNGFFVFTHRTRSKSKPTIKKIPNKDIIYIETTG